MVIKIHTVTIDIVNEDAGTVKPDVVIAVTASYAYARHLADGYEAYCDGVCVHGPDVPNVPAADFEIPF